MGSNGLEEAGWYKKLKENIKREKKEKKERRIAESIIREEAKKKQKKEYLEAFEKREMKRAEEKAKWKAKPFSEKMRELGKGFKSYGKGAIRSGPSGRMIAKNGRRKIRSRMYGTKKVTKKNKIVKRKRSPPSNKEEYIGLSNKFNMGL